MTLTSTTTVVSYAGDGSTSSFAIPFLFLDSDHIRAVLTDSGGADTEWTLGTEYSVTGVGEADGGTLIVDIVPTDYRPAVGEVLTIERVTPLKQETSLPLGGPLPSASVERMVDQAVMNIQETAQDITRSLRYPVSDSVTLSAELPTAASRASKYLAFDANGEPLASTGPTGDSSIPVSAFIETLLDDANAAAALATLGAQADLDVVSQVDAEAGTATDERVWTAQRVAQAIAALSTLPRSYLAGLTLSNGTDADHDIDIAVGECRDSANGANLRLATAITKQIDAPWASGTAAGGLFAGSVANNTWYHVFLIRKDSDGSIDAGFDTSVTAANIPTGYTAYRRLGSVRTDGSANILPFTQRGNHFGLTTPIKDHDQNTPGTSAVTVTLDYVPTGVVVQADIFAQADNSGTQQSLYISELSSADLAAVSTTGPAFSSAAGTSQGQTAPFMVWTNTSAQIRARVESSGANADVSIWVRGWVDTRGRDS